MSKPYQPSFSIQPSYGFRYFSQPFANNVGTVKDTSVKPDYEPNYKVPDKPITSTTPAVMDSSDDNQNMNADLTQSRVDVANTLTDKGVYGPDNPASIIPGYGMLSKISGPAVPETGFGSPGSISSVTGGIFDDDSRSYNPITGEYNQEYGTSRAFTDYMLNDPMGNIFGDTKNAFNYSKNNLQSQGFEKAMMDSPLATDADGLTEADKVLIAKDLGRDMGFSEPTIRDDGPTVTAIQGKGYTNTGAAPSGSQFSSTGIFSSSNSDNSGDSYDAGSDTGSYTGDDSFEDAFSKGGEVAPLKMNKGGYVGGGK